MNSDNHELLLLANSGEWKKIYLKMKNNNHEQVLDIVHDTFNDNIHERSCCKRSELVDWYKFFKSSRDGSPEWDIICDIIPTCGLGDYLAAAYACCKFGTGPQGLPIGLTIKYVLSPDFENKK